MICLTPRTDRPRIAVLTVVCGEHEHLLSHVDGLSLSTWPPDVHVVTSVRDRAVTRGRLPIRSDRWDTVVPVLPVPPSRDAFCPGAHAAGQAALDAGVDVLIFLSVNVIPSRELIQVLSEAAVEGQMSTPTVWHSTVDKLGPAPQLGYPVAGDLDALVVGEGEAVHGQAVTSARGWCESFAMTARDWRLVLPRVLDDHRLDATRTHIEGPSPPARASSAGSVVHPPTCSTRLSHLTCGQPVDPPARPAALLPCPPRHDRNDMKFAAPSRRWLRRCLSALLAPVRPGTDDDGRIDVRRGDRPYELLVYDPGLAPLPGHTTHTAPRPAETSGAGSA